MSFRSHAPARWFALALLFTSAACTSTPRGGRCRPTTCDAVGAQCGPLYDGCGQELWCGECPGGAVCGQSQANRCGADPTTDVLTPDAGDGSPDVEPAADIASDVAPIPDASTPPDVDLEPGDLGPADDLSSPDTEADAGPTECVEGQHRVAAGCASWEEETLAQANGEHTCVAARGDRVGACWRASNTTTWALKADGQWQTWSPLQTDLPARVGVDSNGELWFLYHYLSAQGKRWRIDRRPTALNQPFELDLGGEDGDLTILPAGGPAIALIAGWNGEAIEYWEGISGSPQTVHPSPVSAVFANLNLASRGTHLAIVYVANDDTSLQVHRRSGPGWNAAFGFLEHPTTSSSVSAALDSKGNVHLAYEAEVGLVHVLQPPSGLPTATVVDPSPGSGESARIALASNDTVFIVDRDAEADCRLHAYAAGTWSVEPIVTERCHGRLDLAIDAADALHLTYVYRFPSGERHVRYRTVPAL